jgi:hypothetical protein
VKLAAYPIAKNTLELGSVDHLTVVRDDEAGLFHFVCYDPTTLRVRWTQRAPGSVADPRGLRDHCGREGLWRARLDADVCELLDRFEPADVVALQAPAAQADE